MDFVKTNYIAALIYDKAKLILILLAKNSI